MKSERSGVLECVAKRHGFNGALSDLKTQKLASFNFNQERYRSFFYFVTPLSPIRLLTKIGSPHRFVIAWTYPYCVPGGAAKRWRAD